ncbi:hypothetical protein [Xenorhabdus bovienii]|uniref:Uncharacterized protein n=1 Tax=Xenorhabdus bovienii str. feltiae Moldova TaxID=1398200 RepID=A0A077NFJ0_XENBV|nr:hypothetical protein [Xenorhabdus bovienii]MCG3461330.1 hypothetical protein [Xenorhabdus bovienii]CDH00937.1 hypothetical protein XBFM1_1910093 [Xenorhabdus bovienii str. feltiae Moldova]
MRNTTHQNMVISSTGEKQLLRVAQMTTFLSELLTSSDINGSRHVSSEGMAAVMECLAEQVEQIIIESSLMNKDIK